MFLKLDEATTRPLLMPHMRLPRPAVMNGVYDGPSLLALVSLEEAAIAR